MITALITTLNEIDQIEECIRSVEWTDEVFLVDSFSTDDTVEFVRSKFPHVKVEQRPYLGAAAQKNWAIDHVSNDWILVVDADERVTPELRDEVRRTLESPKYWAYSVGRRNFVLGRELLYSGLQHDRVTRLFHRKHARYPNRRVHADLVVDGDTGMLREKFLHNYIRAFDHMTAKMVRYGVWAGAQLFISGRRASLFAIVFHPLWRFFRDYVLRFGFLDGTPGLITVGMHSYYTFWKYVKLWEYSELQRLGRPVPLPPLDTNEERWKMPWEKDDLVERDLGP